MNSHSMRGSLHSPLGARLALVLAGCVPGAGLAAPLTGGEFSLVGDVAPAHPIVQGGEFTVRGAPTDSAPQTVSGGEFEVRGGFVGVFLVAHTETDVPTLTLTRLPTGEAQLSWPADASGFVLEFTTAPGNGPWQTVTPAPTDSRWVTDPNQPARFFRLRKP